MLGGHVKKIKISGFNYILGYRQFWNEYSVKVRTFKIKLID